MPQLTEVLPSIAVAPEWEKRELASHTQLEEEWYQSYKRYETNEDILSAARIGELVIVSPDKNIQPIARLRNPELRDSFPPYILPHSRKFLRYLGREWKKEVKESSIANAEIYRLSLTSLARSEEMQAAIVAQEEKLANPRSTHCVGAAFDIDASGYYVIDREKGLMAAAHPGRNKKTVKKISQLLKGRVSPTERQPLPRAEYQYEITEALVKTARRLHDMGLVNAIVEYEGTANQCVHMAPNPYAELPLEPN